MRKTFIFLALASASVAVYAASTGTTQLQTAAGSGAGSANGDFVSDSDAGALNTAYRYFIEVPPGLTALNVDIFDADIGLGGTAEAAAGRDRARTAFNTIAAYSLIGPDGVARRTTFTTGSVTAPAGGDNAWLSFFSSTGDSVRDDFTTVAYTNNDGTLNWAGNWIETNDNNAANNGNIVITGGQLRIRDNGDANPSAIEREANLSGWPTATLTFDVSTQNVEPGDQVRVDVSANGGGSWTTLETFTGAVTGSRTYNITGFIASNTRVRFITVGTGYTGTDSFLVDNLQIKNSVIRNGHWELRVDQSSAVTGTTASDINAFGIRAHDGNSGAGGVELPIYADSFVGVGVNPPASGTASRNYTLYPYVTSGCTCGSNDFDFDSNRGTVGSLVYTARTAPSPSASFSSASLSVDNTWARNTISGWTSDTKSTDYGIWQLAATITSYVVNGAANGNYATMWDSSFAAGANPPTANPQANALRLYFASDAGAAPVKPYLEQVLTNRAQGLLPAATPTRFTVTVKISNPTPYPITFSPTHLVTANVPGSGAVYGGNAQVGQGTIVSQPAVGGTGNITWNPGTVAAGVTTILAYDVVVTASSGQRVPVTGTVASGNGTRATFVDETGNATQTRALSTLGPICELAATQALLTEVLLSSFEANVHGSAAVVTWETASEAGTIGFNLYRVDNTGALTPVNDTLLTANAGAPQGGRYRFVDVHITDDAPSYVLEELTADGRTVQYGPFAATAGGDDVVTGDVYEQEPHSNGQRFAPPGHARKAKPDAAIVGVRTTGLTRVTAADLAATLAMPEASVRAAMATGRISITDRGADVAWLAEADNASLLFFAQASDSIFSNERMYRIALEKGTPMRSVAVMTAPEQITTFTATQQFEKDALSVTVLPLDPDSDYWFWDFISSGNATAGKKTFVLDVPAVASTAGAILEVRMQGALAQNTHHARVSINGTRIGDAIWTALNASSVQLPVPTGVLRDGANTILIEGVLENGARSDLFYIDGFAVQYVRFARAVNGTLDMHATPGDVVTPAGFTGDAIALEVSQRQQPVLLTGAASFVVPQNATALFFSDPSAISAPSSMRAAANASLSDRKNRADYLIITNDALRDGANALAQLRARDGLVPSIVDVDDIYDEFSGGNVTPYAIRDFLSATRSWSRAPRYVVLAGIGTLDYRNLTVGPGLIPPFMTKTSSGLFAADSLFTDFDSDGLPDVAIGRIPVATNAQMLAYVAKLDGSAQASNGTPVFSADAFDRAANFKNESATVESALPGRSITHVYIDDLGTTARASFLGAWRNGSPFVSWLGHGGVDRISKTSLLTAADAPSLVSTSGQLPVFVAMTCTINRFELGSVQALGTALTAAPNAGALAVWSASGLSSYRDATQLEQTFVRLAANSDSVRLGDLVLQSLAANKSIGETANIYLLLGDPAIPLSLPGLNPAVDHQPGDPE